jgi:hypothetical protein
MHQITLAWVIFVAHVWLPGFSTSCSAVALYFGSFGSKGVENNSKSYFINFKVI